MREMSRSPRQTEEARRASVLEQGLVFLIAVFLSAFLVFQVQPLVSRHILPWFGGTPAVWTTCLLFFQSLLCLGYGYAHGLSRLPVTRQAIVHSTVLAVAALLPVTPDASWKPAGEDDPQLRILMMLSVSVGLPYLALSATGPLLQSWFWRVYPERSPYPLYALSNAGSLIALLTYPTVFEPWLTGSQQAWAWRGGFLLFATLCAIAGYRAAGRPLPEAAPDLAETSPSRGDGGPLERALWVGWSAAGVLCFMAVTNQLTLNIAAVPFLWVLPLGIYLSSFIITFSGLGIYRRRRFLPLMVFSVVTMVLLVQAEIPQTQASLWKLEAWQQIAAYALALGVLCTVCHGELYQLRPPAQRLTGFYLANAFGGALGGLIIGFVAPMMFLLHQELHLALFACCGLLALTAFYGPTRDRSGGQPGWAAAAAFASLGALTLIIAQQTATLLEGTTTSRRNFFGLLRVQDVGEGDPSTHVRRLWDGSILHGYQFQHPDRMLTPTAYYTAGTGGGALLGIHRAGEGRHIGVIGLGIGTLAAYGRADDRLRFYEINPAVVEVAKGSFGYLSGTPARWEVVLGDARLQLEEEPPQDFDILLVDAFSSDSVPVHLLTVEAFEEYERHLNASGVLAIHVSNLHLDLASLVHALAAHRGLEALAVHSRNDPERGTISAIWILLARHRQPLANVAKKLTMDQRKGLVRLQRKPRRAVPVWTDDYSNLMQLLD